MAFEDHIGRELAIGNVVVMSMPGYSDICLGTIVEFTPKRVRVEYENNWNMMSRTLVEPKTLFLVNSYDLVEYLLKNDGKLAKKR